MDKRTYNLIITILLAIVLLVGCSGSGDNPVASSPAETPGITSNDIQSSQAETYLLGYYDILLDPEAGTMEAMENRTVEFTLNIVPFLNKMTIPMNGITLDNIVLHQDDPGVLGVDVKFTVYHPFPGYDQYNAYDLRGVIIGDGTDTMAYEGLRVARNGTDLWMKNPDGYTRWFNPTEFTSELIFGYAPGGWQNHAGNATLNPYKYYSKHLAADDNLWSFLTIGPNFDGMFESGSGRTMELEFVLPPDGNGILFGYAVVVSWEEQGPTGPYHPSNLPEPVAASVNVTPDIWYNETDGSGGDLILDIDLFAWDYQPSTIKIESSVLENIESIDAASEGAPSGDHVSTYHFEAEAKPLNTGDGHYYWIIAEYDAFDYSNGLVGIPHADGVLAGFFRYDLPVGTDPFNQPPTCDLTADVTFPWHGTLPVTVTFDSGGADPNPGDILTYEWSENGTDWTSGDETNIVEYTAGGTYSMYVRVTDNSGAFSECSIVNFLINEGPVAIADTVSGVYMTIPGGSLDFTAEDSYDPDGTIVSWEWDSDEDGQYDDYSGEIVEIDFPTEGTFIIDLLVTDNDGGTDTLDTPIQITVLDKVIHVDVVNGGGASEDGSAAHPFDALQEGVDAVPDDTGWTIYVHAGTYYDDLTLENPADPLNSPGGMMLLSGLSNVTVLAEDGVILDGPQCLTYQKAYIRLRSSCQDIVVDNFVFNPSYAYQSAIWADGGDVLTVQNCSIEPPNTSYGFLEFFRSQNTSNVLVQNNEMDTFNSCSTYMSVFVINGGSNVTITENNVYKLNNWVGHNIYQTGEGYVAMYNVNDGEVSKNKFGGDHHRSCSSTNYVQSYGVSISNGSNIVIRNNLIYDTYFRNTSGTESRNWGVRIYGSASNIEIYHNTLDRVGVPTTYTGTGYTYGIRIENNNVHTIHSNIITNIEAPSAAVAYGIYTNTSQANLYGCVWNVNGGTSGLYGGGAYADAGCISDDPLYVDPDNFDYHLDSGSPCSGTGMSGEDMGCYGGSDPLVD